MYRAVRNATPPYARRRPGRACALRTEREMPLRPRPSVSRLLRCRRERHSGCYAGCSAARLLGGCPQSVRMTRACTVRVVLLVRPYGYACHTPVGSHLTPALHSHEAGKREAGVTRNHPARRVDGDGRISRARARCAVIPAV
eukprot:365288-Chlamydomonas_euryale.AAC.9